MNEKSLHMEEINERQIKVLRCLVFKMGVNKNARILTEKLQENLSKKYKKTYVSLSKTKRLLKNFLALSYKSHQEVVSKKLSEVNIQKRKDFIRLFI